MNRAHLQPDATVGSDLGDFEGRRALAAIRSLADPIVVVDATDRIVEVNPAAERFFETERRDLIGSEFAPLIVPEDFVEQHRAGVARLARAETALEPIRQDLVACRRNGERFMAEVTLSAMHLRDEQLLTIQLRDVTLMRDVLDRLKLSDDEQRVLIEYSDTVVTILDPDGTWRSSSNRGGRGLGYPAGYDPDDGIFSLIHPDDVEAASVALTEVVAGTRGPEDPIETRMAAADGSWRIYETVGTDLSHHPAVNGIVLQSKDVTSRVRAEQDLRSTTRRLEALITNLRFAVLVEDGDGRILITNESFTKLFGLPVTPEELIGCECAAGLEADSSKFRDPAGFVAGVQRCLAGRVPVLGEELAMVDGRFLERDYVPINVDGDEGLGHLWVYRDVTNRTTQTQAMTEQIEEQNRWLRVAQAELRQQAEFLRNVLDTMDSAVIVTDTEGVIIAVGGSAERLLGGAEQKLIGSSMSSHIDGCHDVLPAWTDGHQQEVALRTPGGASVPALMVTSTMHGDDGRAIGHVRVATDLTERKKLEDDLRQAQKMEGIGQLAAGVAHEINTPVQFIGDSTRFLGDVLGDLMSLLEEYQLLRAACTADPRFAERCEHLVDLEQEADLDLMRAEAPAAVERTIGGVQRVSRIVAALKQFAHPSAGTAEPVDLNQIIETTLVVARNEYRYVADVDSDLGEIPDVIGDHGDLSQVVLNLVVNAAHAIADRGDDERGSITIRTARSATAVEFSISDTGTGIPEAIIDRVFDPFFTTKEVGRGTGQGLAIVRSIVVDRHHGSIDIATEPGAGTTFTISFPIPLER